MRVSMRNEKGRHTRVHGELQHNPTIKMVTLLDQTAREKISLWVPVRKQGRGLCPPWCRLPGRINKALGGTLQKL